MQLTNQTRASRFLRVYFRFPVGLRRGFTQLYIGDKDEKN